MADDEKYKVPLFDGSNYSNWKFRMQILLEEHDLFEFVGKRLTTLIAELPSATATAQALVLRKSDRKCKSLITQRISDSHLEYVKDKDTAYDMWKALSDNFERADIASQLRLRKVLLTMRYEPSEIMASHFLKFDKLIRELKSTGATLEETDIVCHLLLTMPEEYNMVVTALETMSSGQLTLSFVKTRLLDEEAKRVGNSGGSARGSSSTVFSATANKRHGNRNKSRENNIGLGVRRDRFDYRCHHCGIIGHKRSECRKLKYEKKNSEIVNVACDNGDNQKTFVFHASENRNKALSVKWFLDSGSTEHLATEDTKLFNVQKLKTPINIRVAKSGHVLTAKEIGSLKVRALVNGQINNILMTGVLSVSGLECNLLSVRKLEMNDFTVIFKDGKGIVKKGNSTVVIAHRKDKLYELYFENVVEAANVCRVAETTDLWHHRLGHLSNSGMKKLVNMADGINVKELKIPSELCKTCVSPTSSDQTHQSKASS